MGKVAQNSTKYLIRAELSSSGLVEKPDVVGALFGQTEGLLGEDMDLRELQERGRIGRIEVNVQKEDGSSTATIEIPSSLDSTNTAILAASLETIDRVGPTNATIEVKEIRDERVSKQDYIRKRAKQLLEDMHEEKPSQQEITDEVRQEVRKQEITEYRGFEAGPEASESDEIILVEGRADLLNLLKHGVKNAVDIGGTDVPEKLEEVVEEAEITAFLDGDRGGELILQELNENIEPDYVSRAPENKEVEELGKEEVYSCLRDREPAKYFEPNAEKEVDPDTVSELQETLDQLVGTRAAHILDSKLEVTSKTPIDTLEEELESLESCHAVVLDGEIDREIVKKVEALGAEYLVGMEKDGYATSSGLELMTREELELEAEARS